MEISYNYTHFHHISDETFDRFPAHLPVGSVAPGGTLIRLADNASVNLSDLCRQGPVVMEFGSYT